MMGQTTYYAILSEQAVCYFVHCIAYSNTKTHKMYHKGGLVKKINKTNTTGSKTFPTLITNVTDEYNWFFLSHTCIIHYYCFSILYQAYIVSLSKFTAKLINMSFCLLILNSCISEFMPLIFSYLSCVKYANDLESNFLISRLIWLILTYWGRTQQDISCSKFWYSPTGDLTIIHIRTVPHHYKSSQLNNSA